ncbi:Uncharacterised protein [Klebsiella aerogenes]|nr:Uncharacterised protein [Klebsiella aerogenes]
MIFPRDQCPPLATGFSAGQRLTPAGMRLSGCCRAVVGSLSWWLAARFTILHHRFTSAERYGAYEYEQQQSGQTITAAARLVPGGSWPKWRVSASARFQRIENGERPGLETLSALAAVFEVTVAEIGGEARREDAPGQEASLDLRIEEAKARVHQESRFFRSLSVALVVCVLLAVLNRFTNPTVLLVRLGRPDLGRPAGGERITPVRVRRMD